MFGFQIKYLSFFFGLISILSFFNIIYSYYFNLYLNLDTYFLSLFLSSILAILFYSLKISSQKTSIFQKILTVFLGYILLPLILSIPFYLSIYNLTFINSFFEAVSGFTSTGFTIFENIKNIDQSLILWRSTIQWIGGLYFLFSIIYLIDIYDENFKKTLTNFFSFNTTEELKQAIKVFFIYSGITLVIFIILNLFSIRTFDSLNLAFSLISSGGFLPTNNLSSIIKDDAQTIILSFLMLTSFFSIFFSYNLFFFKRKNINFLYEDINLIIYLVIVLIIFFLFFSFNQNFLNYFLSISSSMSNIGFTLENSNTNLTFVYLILVIIGGSFFSTSSGLRFMKIYSLFIYSVNQILSFSRPKNIYKNKLFFSEVNFDFNEISKYFLSVLVFILSLFILTTLLTMSEFSFENSFKLSILTLMNTVNSSSYGLSDLTFYNLSYFTKYCLIFFMIVGRIELLTILLLIKKFLFKN